MNKAFILFISAISLINSTACKSNIEEETSSQNIMEIPKDMRQITITVGSKIFKATVIDSPTTEAFIALLPITINMKDLNGNEKYFDLPQELPTNAFNSKTIQNGDLLVYGSTTLVLFYKSFTTSYSYTRIASVDNPAGLAKAVGSGNVTVIFSAD
ncbi:cyclophilin-like fold protein [Flavobacterium frigoris]|uniref:Cyclophilin-like domain-containing protein n=1 Tax=Flavobacterium frigoris (strain PS1) TaxID=1086011 RepID=H7FSA5_FLAFP|nr:cyclophilin-like fold protein [Flavobacterium frigoris]EIA08602.1 hypothetical protein HJ01_02324 [Flavobacterium frigoris PS1]